MEGSESALHGIRREMSEETSLHVKDLKISYVGTYANKRKNANMSLYIAHILSADFKIFEGEREEVYGLDEALDRHDLDPDTRIIAEKYKELSNAKHN